MCLYITKNSRVRKAIKDIKCLKIVYEDANGNFKTPFRNYPVKLGETYISDIKTERSSYDDRRLIQIGLHSLLTVRDCNLVLRKINSCGLLNAKIVECTIPKGSRVIKGMFDGDWESYVSDTITYDKIIQY